MNCVGSLGTNRAQTLSRVVFFITPGERPSEEITKPEEYMKLTLCLIGAVALLPTVGCVVREHRDDRDHGRLEQDRRFEEEHRDRSEYRSYPEIRADVTTNVAKI